MEKQISYVFGIAEKSVKELINSYLILFKKDTVLQTCNDMAVSSKRFSKYYIDYAEMLNLLNTGVINKHILDNSSMLKVPEKSAEAQIENNGDNILPENKGVYLLTLQLVANNTTWDDKIFEPFGNNVKQLKALIGNMLNMAHYVFGALKQHNPNELESIVLEADTENVTLKIKDSRCPKYNHNYRIGFKLEKKIV